MTALGDVRADTPTDPPTAQWWRTAVIYQIYPRSFADHDGDGMGDLRGITSRLEELAELGVDAIWLSPFMTSPQRDAGYDVSDYCDVDPLFGTLADFDAMLGVAHALNIRVIVDIVPNHCSDQHPWFLEACAAAPGSAARARYHFRDGRGASGELPPNNWQSVFGGSAWTRIEEADGTPGQWYLHLFDPSQPDFEWNNQSVRAEFLRILRFWLDRGVDGFRIDVAHGLIKAPGLPDYTPAPESGSMGGDEPETPYWGQPGVHEIYREWRRLAEEYPGQRALVAEAWLPTAELTALWVRPDELHQAFNFPYLMAKWDAAEVRQIIIESLRAYGSVGAPATWVLSNHDVVRHATRLALDFDNPHGDGIGHRSPLIDHALGLRRARAATTLMLALPGSAYLYQGEELGLPEAIDLPDAARQDPTWRRSGGTRYGRDGCRVPLPWEAEAPSAGFGPGDTPWLPQPAQWPALARDRQRGRSGSTLELYRTLLSRRRAAGLGAGTLDWLDAGEHVVAFRNGSIGVAANFGPAAVPLAAGAVLTGAVLTGAVLISSAPLDGTGLDGTGLDGTGLDGSGLDGAVLPPDTAVWWDAGATTEGQSSG